jgi:hypothetical protein
LSFQENGKLLVGRHTEGTWALEGDRIGAQVRGRDYTLFIKGNQLFDDDDEPLEFLS